MPLTPIDVQQKTFRVALRGYAEDEVDEFLDEVVLSIREYEQRLEEMSFQVGALESQLSENRQTEDAMRRTLLLAEKTASEITEEAQREAERIVSDARAEATSLTSEQSEERDALIQELGRLRHIVADVQGRLGDIAVDTERRLAPVANEIDDTLDDLRPAPDPVGRQPGLVAVPDTADRSWPDDDSDHGIEAVSDERGTREHRFWGGADVSDVPDGDDRLGDDRDDAADDHGVDVHGVDVHGMDDRGDDDRGDDDEFGDDQGFESEHRYDGPNLVGAETDESDESVEFGEGRSADLPSPTDDAGETGDWMAERRERAASGWRASSGSRGGFLPDEDRQRPEDAPSPDDSASQLGSDDGESRGDDWDDLDPDTPDPDRSDPDGGSRDDATGAEEAGRRRPWERFSD